MKKNICPYLDSQSRCTHKLGLQKRNKNKLLSCPYSNELKCIMYIEWIEVRKSLSKVPKAIREEMYEGHRK